MQSTIYAVIVNYRAGQLIEDNLPTLAEQISAHQTKSEDGADITNSATLPPILIVDNHSENGDAQKLAHFIEEQGLSSTAKLIAHNINGGFGAGNNVALKQILATNNPPPYILFLNPDAKLHNDALIQMHEFLTQNPKAGFVGCAIENEMQERQRSAFRFFSIIGDFENTIRTGPFSRIFKHRIVAPPMQDQAHICDWVSGAVFLARTSTLQDIDIFDEDFFLYFEETDLMRRGKNKGWESWYYPGAKATHLEGFSTGTKGGVQDDYALSDHWFRSRNLYFSKHHSVLKHLAADIAWITGTLLYSLRLTVTGKSSRPQRKALKQFLSHWRKKTRF